MTSAFHSLYETTIAQQTSCAGIGLHSGRFVTMTMYPAPAGTGVLFKRTDVEAAKAVVPADYSLVTDTMLGTTLTNRHDVCVSTVEHLMAAIWGLGLDNVLIEIDAGEIPIMDGSSEPFVDIIEQAGIVRLAARRQEIEILEKVTVTQGASVISIEPSSHFSMAIEIDFPGSIISRQSSNYDFSKSNFKRSLCRARTFGFEKDVRQLRGMGLALGGSLENAIVVGDEGVLNAEGLRYTDEFVRHKALDCVGDLFLAGNRLRGHVTAYRPGHGVNNALLHAVFADSANWRLVPAGSSSVIPVHAGNVGLVEAFA